MNSHTPIETPENQSSAAAVKGGDVCVILNPKSGKKETKPDPDELSQMMQRAFDAPCDIKQVSKDHSPTKLAEDAIREGYRIVVAAGGDGTIAGVANALMDTDVAMGVLPMGTFNYFSRGLGLPEDIPEAIETLGRSAPKPMHVGCVNSEIFLNNASLGVYPSILRERETLYKKWGRSRITAYWSVLSGLMGLKRPYDLTVTVDGETTIHKKTALAFVANSAYQLEAFSLDGAEDVRDGSFALYLTNATNWRQLIAHAMNLFRNTTEHGREFQLLIGKDIEIDVARKKHMWIARDGEKERMKAPFVFNLRENALNVMVPDSA